MRATITLDFKFKYLNFPPRFPGSHILAKHFQPFISFIFILIAIGFNYPALSFCSFCYERKYANVTIVIKSLSIKMSAGFLVLQPKTDNTSWKTRDLKRFHLLSVNYWIMVVFNDGLKFKIVNINFLWQADD